LLQAFGLSRRPPPDRPFAIWHVRRNKEMLRALIARDLLRLPIRLVFTSSSQERHSLVPRLLIGRMDAVIATSDGAARPLARVAAIVPHGIDTQRYLPAADRDAAWRATGYPGGRGIATVGRVRPGKGTDVFVEAMVRLLPQHPDLTALVIGTALARHRSFQADLETRIAAAGLAGRILFTGQIANERMPALIRGLTMLVAPPPTEPYGMTVLEAMASAVPFVANDTGHWRAHAGADAGRLIVPRADPDLIAALAAPIVADPALHAELAQRLRRRAVEVFDIATEVAGVRAVYEALWAGRHPAIPAASQNA
jgi:mannosyltransferase